MQPLDATALPGTVTQHLSVFDLFLQADSIVKLVMLLLLAGLVLVVGDHLRQERCGCAGCSSAATSFEETFWSGGSLDDLFDRVGQRPDDPMARSSPPPCANGAAAPPRACSARRRCAPACSSASSG